MCCQGRRGCQAATRRMRDVLFRVARDDAVAGQLQGELEMCCFVLPGTTRLPGSYKENERQAPRLVKTYTERLKDMKRERRPYHKPPQPTRQRGCPGGYGVNLLAVHTTH